jgi:transposase-like protein/predicted RNA-binding Zn-ribbon protein involved in translation (DUF1610 family)
MLEVYKITYPITLKYICNEQHIGNKKGNYIGKERTSMTIYNPRQLRALAILSSGIDAIKRTDKKHYRVRSQNGNGYYDVTKRYGIGWTCTCHDWAEHQQDCKHTYAVQFSMQLRLETEREVNTNNILQVSEEVKCPICKSNNVVKNGQRKCNKGINQRYKCLDCGYRFVVDSELSRLKATPEAVSISMDLYFKGNSLSKIKHHLKMFYKLNVARNTILGWIQKFSTILNEYADKHTPNVGDLWHSDEMSGGIREKGKKGNYEWIWNLMDSDTRYLLASRITKSRDVKDARKPLREAKVRADKRPKAIITDGLHSYNEAAVKEYYDKTDPTIHFRTPARRKQYLNQNLERLNGTIRERLKVMRGFDSEDTGQILIDGERFYYNNIRPHMGLDGTTPSQMANLPYVPLENNPWLTFIKAALRNKIILSPASEQQ